MAEIDAMKKSNDDLEARCKKLQDDLATANEAHDQHYQKSLEAQKKLAGSNEETQALHAKVKEIEQKALDDIAAAAAASKEKEEQLSEECQRLQKSVTVLEGVNRTSQTQCEQLRDQIVHAKERESDLHKALEEGKQREQELSSTCQGLQEELETGNKKAAELQEVADERHGRLTQHEQEKEDLKGKLSQIEAEHTEARMSLKQSQEKHQELEQAHGDLQSKLNEIQGSAGNASAEVESLKAQLETERSNGKQWRAVILEEQERNRELQSQIAAESKACHEQKRAERSAQREVERLREQLLKVGEKDGGGGEVLRKECERLQQLLETAQKNVSDSSQQEIDELKRQVTSAAAREERLKRECQHLQEQIDAILLPKKTKSSVL